MVQFIGYRLNGPNIFRLAESIRGETCTQFLVALDIVVEEFEERPDGFRIEIIPPPPDNPLGETVNLIFIIWTSSKTEPIPFGRLKETTRMQEAKGYLREKGFDEINRWKLIREYWN